MKKEYKELNEIFANGEALNIFADGKERIIKPVTMKTFGEFMKNLTAINSTELWVNYLQEDMEKALEKVLSLSFDDDIDTLTNAINAKNYAEIIKKVMDINGINIAKKDETEGNGEKKE